MAFDADTITRLQTLQTQLEGEQASLQATLANIQSVKDTIAGFTDLSMDELLELKEIAFADLPPAEEVQANLAKVSTALSALVKVLPAPSASA